MSKEIITLCGSTRFKEDFMRINSELSLQGKIVLSVANFTHADNLDTSEEQKKLLDDLHKEKIDMSHSIYVIDKGGYIGDSTKSEIDYAAKKGKKIYYMSNEK